MKVQNTLRDRPTLLLEAGYQCLSCFQQEATSTWFENSYAWVDKALVKRHTLRSQQNT